MKPPINVFDRKGDFTQEFKDYVNSLVDKEVAKVTTNGEFDRDKAIAYIREHSKGGK